MSQAAKLPRTGGSLQNNRISVNKTAPGSEAARDKWLLPKTSQNSGKSSAPGSEAARDKWLLPKASQVSGKNAPGSEAAWDKWLFFPKHIFCKQNLPQAAKLPRTSGFFQKQVKFLEKNLPQAANLPGISGSSPPPPNNVSL